MTDKLSEYKSKRDQKKTSEPFSSTDSNLKHLVFVVQKHQATALHFDFRLEVDGAMPSWAVPKGPSLNSKDKRLAMKVEDHPLDYRHFEGTIPEGNYGAGTVMVWDEGTYYPEVEGDDKTRQQIKDKKDGNKVMDEGIRKGELKFFLQGKKLKGSFALIKTKGFAGKNAWLLIKHKDKYSNDNFDANKLDWSAKTKRTFSEIR